MVYHTTPRGPRQFPWTAHSNSFTTSILSQHDTPDRARVLESPQIPETLVPYTASRTFPDRPDTDLIFVKSQLNPHTKVALSEARYVYCRDQDRFKSQPRKSTPLTHFQPLVQRRTPLRYQRSSNDVNTRTTRIRLLSRPASSDPLAAMPLPLPRCCGGRCG